MQSTTAFLRGLPGVPVSVHIRYVVAALRKPQGRAAAVTADECTETRGDPAFADNGDDDDDG